MTLPTVSPSSSRLFCLALLPEVRIPELRVVDADAREAAAPNLAATRNSRAEEY
jgi:hypothetical protein